MMGFVSPQARWVGLSANPWPTSQFSSCSPETRKVSVGYSLIGWLGLSTNVWTGESGDYDLLEIIRVVSQFASETSISFSRWRISRSVVFFFPCTSMAKRIIMKSTIIILNSHVLHHHGSYFHHQLANLWNLSELLLHFCVFALLRLRDCSKLLNIITTIICVIMIMIILFNTIDRVMSIGRSIRIRIRIPAAFSDTQSSPPPLTCGPDLKKSIKSQNARIEKLAWGWSTELNLVLPQMLSYPGLNLKYETLFKHVWNAFAANRI